ncbi:hypothetical protein IQ06DRAFT_94929 [Phaeosphaeriaceae sp. SRC1lsM3a]|nr:hypothetical protein IQ06DRAFT_94929 [Stagonospora sp. SRC1lsM3a]
MSWSHRERRLSSGAVAFACVSWLRTIHSRGNGWYENLTVTEAQSLYKTTKLPPDTSIIQQFPTIKQQALMSNTKYTVTVTDSSSNQQLLSLSKNRYSSEQDLIASFAHKLLDPNVDSITFTKSENEVHVRFSVRGGDAASARQLLYGSSYAREGDEVREG